MRSSKKSTAALSCVHDGIAGVHGVIAQVHGVIAGVESITACGMLEGEFIAFSDTYGDSEENACVRFGNALYFQLTFGRCLSHGVRFLSVEAAVVQGRSR